MAERGHRPWGLVLAAGAGRRFEPGIKQLARLHEGRVLDAVIKAASQSQLEETIVVLGANADRILEEAELGTSRAVICSSWSTGLSASLRSGLSELPEDAYAVVMLGDQPMISADSIDRILASRASGVAAVRASYGGVPGHPTLIERELFFRLRNLRGDRGASAVLPESKTVFVECDDVADATDIDTREDLVAILAMQR